MKSLAGSPACVPITFFTAQLACSLESAGPFCGLAFRLCPCKAQGCVGCRQHSLSAGGLRPLASPESRGRKRGSLSLPGPLHCPEPTPEAGGSPACRGLEPVFETETVISPSVEEHKNFQPGRRCCPSPEKKVRFPDSRLNISK